MSDSPDPEFNDGFDAAGLPIYPPPRPAWLRLIVSEVEHACRKLRAKRAKESATERTARRTARVTMATAIATVVVAVLTYIVLQGQLDEMKSNGKQSEKIIENTAAQAKATAITASTIQRQIRAYTFVKPFPEIYGLDSRSFLQTWIILRNGGATPATDVTVTANIDALMRPPPDDLFSKGERVAKIEDTLDPSMETLRTAGIVTTNRQFLQSEIDAITIGKDRKIYVWGLASYIDVFHEKRHTYFCFSYSGAYVHQNEGVNSGIRAANLDYCHHPDSD